MRHVSIVVPVYRDADRATALIDTLRRQRLPLSSTCEIIVVDDGSGDGTADKVGAAAEPGVRLLKLESNRGRAIARNRAAAEARGDAILFLDCDCLPAGDDLVARHLATLIAGGTASIGPVIGGDSGFWHRYQSEASERRAYQHTTGTTYSGSSQNLMVARWAFERIGGFDPAYQAYGFEDRDLQLRLSALGPIAWTADAVVRHMDALCLRTISRKMMEAGERSSTRFAHDHPHAYRALGYAVLDVRLRPWLRIPAMFAAAVVDTLAAAGDRFLDSALLPYRARHAYVRTVTGLSYLAGTSRAPHFRTRSK